MGNRDIEEKEGTLEECRSKEATEHGWSKEMPEQGQRGDTGGGTPLRGLQPIEEPTPKQLSKKQGTAKQSNHYTPASVSCATITSPKGLTAMCGEGTGNEPGGGQRWPEGS